VVWRSRAHRCSLVPVRTLNAGPNPRYFGPGRGVTYLNFLFRAKLQQIQHSA